MHERLQHAIQEITKEKIKIIKNLKKKINELQMGEESKRTSDR